MIGTGVVWIAFVAALLSAWSYYQAVTKKKETLKLARRTFHAMVVAVMVSSFLLLLFILQHRFEYAYIYGYSSKDLPIHLLISTFWAGQEGSFLFWTFCGSVIGIFVLSFTRKRHIEGEIMSVYAFVQAFLLLMLITKSPFKYIWDAYPGQVPPGSVPTDGRGLNPLLQNFWMVAHPPVLFLGFAAAAVPFSFAVGALWRRRFTDWLTYSLPWVLFAVLALGAGLMLGGYWAYGVLGWGGWWGWDPVENSSLIPWITGAALLHTMIVQKKTGKLMRTNFFLAVLTFLLVIYSTFLTRSGVLGSASVHSFTDPGALVYTLLILWMASMGGLGFGLMARRWKEMKALAQPTGFVTKESFVTIGVAMLGASALVIFFGTSWPILASASLEPAFYDKVNLPIAILMALVLGVSLKLRWHQESRKELLQKIALPFVASAAALVVLVSAGVREWQIGALGFAAFFAFFINVAMVYHIVKENPRSLGGPLAHVGIALLLLGILGSGHYGQKQTTSLTVNEPREVFGYQLTYLGAYPMKDGRWKFLVNVEKDGKRFRLEPVMFQSSYNDNLMRNPDYASFLTKDFYIEPVSLEGGSGRQYANDLFELTKGEPKNIGDMRVTFLRFDMTQHGKEEMASGGGFVVGAVLEVERAGKKEQVIPVTTYREGQQPEPKTAMLKDGKLGFQLLAMNVDAESKSSRIQVNVVGLREQSPKDSESDILVIEASLKPFISLVWIAAALVLIGLYVAIKRRQKETLVQGADEFQQATRRGNSANSKKEMRKELVPEPVVEEKFND